MVNDRFLSIMYSYGWKINKSAQQRYGSPADVVLTNDTYFTIIDDGYCVGGDDYLFHIYNINLDGKIFEGRLRDEADFITLMRFLGF